jgi:ribose transport system ATP-binding protein
VFSHISKAYSGLTVLEAVSAEIAPGTFTAIAGENGAGKSTLLKIIAGMEVADEGSIGRGGVTVQPNTVSAHSLGIALVPQELEPLRDLTIYENLFLAHEISTLGFLRRGEMIRRARELLTRFDVDIDPSTRVRKLSVGTLQLLEIMKAVSSNADFLLLDEPTSSLSEREVEHLFGVLNQLRAEGISALFTTHKMAEIRRLADRVLVLRDGKVTMDTPINDVGDHQIVTAMIGRELGEMFPEIAPPGDEVRLEVRGVPPKPGRKGIDLRVRKGEIIGLAGLVGAGRTEFLETVFGARNRRDGTVSVDGSAVRPNSIRSAISHSFGFVPEERKTSGLVLTLNIIDNASLSAIPQVSRLGFIGGARRHASVKAVMDRLSLRCRNLRQSASTLSGGNQQKVVVGRWLVGNSRVLLLDEPTRGVDIGARSEIYRIISDLAASGASIVMASSDMNEVIGLCHRVLVFSDAALAGELSREETHRDDAQERIFTLASSSTDDPTSVGS